MKLAAPWITYVSELKALFEKDPQVKIEYDEDHRIVKMLVDNEKKAEALSKLIPAEKDFGNVRLKITINPSNKKENNFGLICDAFDGNLAVNNIQYVNSPFGELAYLVFCKEVVQFYNDEMSDPNGNRSTLYQDIATDVMMDREGIFFCTSEEA